MSASTPGSNNMPVTFNAYPLGSMQDNWGCSTQRQSVTHKAARIKGSKKRGLGGGDRQWTFDTLQAFTDTADEIDWILGLGSNVDNAEQALKVTANGKEKTLDSSAICANYNIRPEGSKHLRISWVFEMSETAMGTF